MFPHTADHQQHNEHVTPFNGGLHHCRTVQKPLPTLLLFLSSHGIVKKPVNAAAYNCKSRTTRKIHRHFVLRSRVIEPLVFVLLKGCKVLKDS